MSKPAQRSARWSRQGEHVPPSSATTGGGQEGRRPPVGSAAVEQIEIPVGPFTFDALRAGPVDGEPVLLLHGFPQTGWSWRHQLEALAEAGYQAVAPDQRGYSPRARPTETEAYALDLLVGDALGMADHLGWDRFHLVGHDWGAMVAWVLAGTHQDRVATLTTLSVPHPFAFAEAMAATPPEGEPTQRERSSYIDVFRTEGSEDMLLKDDAFLLRRMFTGDGELLPLGAISEEEAEHYVQAVGTPEAMRAALSWYRAMSPAALEGFGAITMPTMHIWSTDDIALGRPGAEATAKYVEGPYRFVVLEDITHWIAEQAPERTNELLLEQVRTHPIG